MDLESIVIDKLLVEYKNLIHKTLYRLNIRQTHMDYDDFFQEMQIQLIKVYESYEGNIESDIESERYQFTAYAGQGLYWHGLNLIRQSTQDTIHAVDDQYLDWLMDKEPISTLYKPQSHSNIYLEDFFKQAKERLKAEDYLLLLYLAEDTYTVQEIADELEVSRDTIYQRKKNIGKRLEGIKKCLMD